MLRLSDAPSNNEPLDLDLLRADPSENRIVSPCGRFESFYCNGYYYEIDWDEIDPPGAEEEEGIPHAQVMEESRKYFEQLREQR